MMLFKVLKKLPSQSVRHRDIHIPLKLLTEHLMGIKLLFLLLIMRAMVVIVARGVLVDGATHGDLPL